MKRVRARVRRLGLMSTVAVARIIHLRLVNRLCIRKFSSRRVLSRIAMLMTMPRVRLRVPELIIQLHFAPLFQGNFFLFFFILGFSLCLHLNYVSVNMIFELLKNFVLTLLRSSFGQENIRKMKVII